MKEDGLTVQKAVLQRIGVQPSTGALRTFETKKG